jgi:acyl-CoA synthetase (AMP-forming)/AMP-acid ligase II
MSATQLKAGIEHVLSREKRPLQYFSLTELPTTDRGKISRNILLEWIGSRDARVRQLDR